MTGKLKPKADDILRKKITKRAREHVALANKVVPDRLLKSPSQKRSEHARIQEARRAEAYGVSCRTAAANLIFDCYTCPNVPCNNIPEACNESMILERCGRCGKPVRHYVDVDFKWTKCEDCRNKP